MKRILPGAFVITFVLLGSSASLPLLRASPLQTNETAANWTIGTLVRIKASKPFVWLRDSASPTGAVIATIASGNTLVVDVATPTWDGVQWWWTVLWGTAQGFVEQDAFDLIGPDTSTSLPSPPAQSFTSILAGEPLGGGQPVLDPDGTPPPNLPTLDVTLVPSPTYFPIAVPPTASPTPSQACTQAQGQVLEKTFRSAVTGGDVAYRIYLPPCYAPSNRRYPYVILLHGIGEDETAWTDTLGVNQTLDQGIARGRLPPMILVMPSGGDPEYENLFTLGASFESLVLNDLMPEIENNYCTLNSQAGRALAGISRGGFWVFEIGLRHPDIFGVLAGHSAFFDPTNAPPANNPLNLAQTVTFAPNGAPHLWLDIGADDVDTRDDFNLFAQTLIARQIKLGYVVYPTGEHVAEYWEAHLKEYLTFYGQDWPLNPQTLPTCK